MTPRAASPAALVALALAVVAPATVLAQNYPTKQITIYSSASPGTNGDAALRMMANKMTDSMGQPVVVELRTAARGA